MITQKRLKEVIHYDPETGSFTRLESRGLPIKGCPSTGKPGKRYTKIFIDGTSYLAHRLAFLYMIGRLPAFHVDHINHVRWDNRWSNIREAGYYENSRNRSLSSRSSSGIPGVSWRPKENGWRSQISTNGSMLYLGSFKDLFSAACSRKSAEIKFDYHQNNGALKGSRP